MPGRWVRVGVLVAGLAIAGCAPTPAPTPVFSPPPTPGPAPSGTTEPWADLVWRPAELPHVPFDEDLEAFTSVAAGPAGFVAVGYRQVGPDRHGIVRLSATGTEWRAVGDDGRFDHVELLDVAASPDGYVLLGVRSGGPLGDHAQTVLFHSADGSTWVASPALPGALDTFPYWMATGDVGVIASAYGAEGEPIVWLAPDGRTFERVELRGDGVAGVVDPEPVPGGFVALGSESGPPRLQRSTDGIDWVATPIDDTGDVVATDLVVGPAGLLVQGLHAPGCSPLASCAGLPVAWWSADGASWGRVPDGASPVTNGGSIVAAAGVDGFVAVDGVSAWWSRDGWHWRPLPEPGDGRIGVAAVAAGAGRIVAVGTENLEDGSAIGRILVGG